MIDQTEKSTDTAAETSGEFLPQPNLIEVFDYVGRTTTEYGQHMYDEYMDLRTKCVEQEGWLELAGKDDTDEYDDKEAATTYFLTRDREGKISAGMRLTPFYAQELQEGRNDPNYVPPLSIKMFGEAQHEVLGKVLDQLDDFSKHQTERNTYDLTRLITRAKLTENEGNKAIARDSYENMFKAFGAAMALRDGLWIFTTTPDLIHMLNEVGITSIEVERRQISLYDKYESILSIIPDIVSTYNTMMQHHAPNRRGLATHCRDWIEEGSRTILDNMAYSD